METIVRVCHCCLSQGVPRRSLVVALIVGTILNLIEQGDAKHDVAVTDLSLQAEASFDRRGVMLEEEVAVPFPEIRLTINITTAASADKVARLKSDLGKFCPVSKVIRQSGTRLQEIWNVTRA